MSPAISVIIPVYKCEKYLSKCIESVLNQTFSDFELILVDDGSPDNSGAICDEYAKKDTRIKVIHKENGGVSSARNEGIRIAVGEYMTFIDSDDYVDDKMLEILYQHINCGVDCVMSGLRYIFSSTGTQKEYKFEPQTFSISEIDKVYEHIDKNFGFSTANAKLYRTKTIRDNQLHYAEEYAILEDGNFVWDYLKYCSTCLIVEDVFYNYRQVEEMSLMKTFNINAIEALRDRYNATEWVVPLLGQENLKKYYEELYFVLIRFLIQIFTRSQLNKKKKKELVKLYVQHTVTRKIMTKIKIRKLSFKKRMIAIPIKWKWIECVYRILQFAPKI